MPARLSGRGHRLGDPLRRRRTHQGRCLFSFWATVLGGAGGCNEFPKVAAVLFTPKGEHVVDGACMKVAGIVCRLETPHSICMMWLVGGPQLPKVDKHCYLMFPRSF